MYSNAMILEQNFASIVNVDVNSTFTRWCKKVSCFAFKKKSTRSNQPKNNVSFSTVGHYQVVHLSDRIDYSNAANIRPTILHLLGLQRSLLIDLSKLIYIDSSGLAVLVEALAKAKSLNLELQITGANNAPLQMLMLTRLDRVFPLYNKIQKLAA